MYKFFKEGTTVPEWLEKLRVDNKTIENKNVLTFQVSCIVFTNEEDGYSIKPVTSLRDDQSIMHLDGNDLNGHVEIRGIGKGGVRCSCEPTPRKKANVNQFSR